MRIGLYGMPTAGKTYILEKISFMEVYNGSLLLRELDPCFDTRDRMGKERTRKALAASLIGKEFIMDGHYAFGDETVFTEEDGRLYDVILYLYLAPNELKRRMEASEKNRKYLKYDIARWQDREILGLREYCHKNNKDFYVLDNPPVNNASDVQVVLDFVQEIKNGYSCMRYARKCTEDILGKSSSGAVTLFDGDRTLITEDSSIAVFGYTTHLYDGNFYTGYQSWKQDREFRKYCFEVTEPSVHINTKIAFALVKNSFVLTSGHAIIWRLIAGQIGIVFYCGKEMSADTKFFVTKFLQEAGRHIIAYGDSMNDYYMLKQADKGFLVTRQDGSVSNSLKGMDMEGLIIV